MKPKKQDHAAPSPGSVTEAKNKPRPDDDDFYYDSEEEEAGRRFAAHKIRVANAAPCADCGMCAAWFERVYCMDCADVRAKPLKDFVEYQDIIEDSCVLCDNKDKSKHICRDCYDKRVKLCMVCGEMPSEQSCRMIEFKYPANSHCGIAWITCVEHDSKAMAYCVVCKKWEHYTLHSGVMHKRAYKSKGEEPPRHAPYCHSCAARDRMFRRDKRLKTARILSAATHMTRVPLLAENPFAHLS